MLFATMENANPIFSIFENNLVNWLLLIILIAYFVNKYVPPLLAGRKESIETALKDASLARAEGVAFFEAQQTKVANAEKEADKILVEAKQVAEQMKAELAAQTKKELADLSAKIEQQIANERQLAILKLRTAAARAAVHLTETTLPQHVTDSVRERLVDQFLGELEAIGK